MTKTEIIITIISAVLVSNVLNAIITHIFYSKKLKKALKHKKLDITAKEIEASLQFFRNLELEINTHEIYNIEDELEQRGSQVNMFGGEAIYPAICSDWKSYNVFLDKIRICREIHEKNYSCKIALNLVYIERYIMQLSLFMSENGNEPCLSFWGAIIYIDLQKWQSKIDKLLVKEINSYTYKLESHETLKWKLLRKKEIERQFESTVLHFLLTNKCRKRDKKIMAVLKDLLSESPNSE